MTRYLNPGLHTRLLLGAILPALVMMGLLGYMSLRYYTLDMERAFKARALSVAQQIGPAAEYALFTGSHHTLQVLIDAALTSDSGITAIVVLDPEGMARASAGPVPAYPLSPGNHLQIIDLATHTTIVAPIRQATLPVDDWPVDTAGGAASVQPPAGHVVVEMSRHELTERQGDMIAIALLILLIGMLLAGWITSQVASSVLAQLDAARRALQQQKDAADALARTDVLTGLANRRAFDETAEYEIQRAVRYGTPLTLVIADIDHFKAINDTHGHHTGDAVLIDFARVLTASVRGIDLVGRWGGEEFIILMPGTDRDEAPLAAERMRLAVAGAPTRIDGKTCGVTASFGVATLSPEAPTLEALLGCADAALYRAKENGRNRVESA
jgi:diguanylate cyclase